MINSAIVKWSVNSKYTWITHHQSETVNATCTCRFSYGSCSAIIYIPFRNDFGIVQCTYFQKFNQFKFSIMLVQTEFILLSIIFLFENCFACTPWPWLYVNNVVVTPVKRRSVRSLVELDGKQLFLYSLQKIYNHSIMKSAFLIIIADKSFTESTLQAFEKCDVDGVYGISWKEVIECQEEFCEKLNILCPTLHEFESFDENDDGRLTLKEYFNYIPIPSG